MKKIAYITPILLALCSCEKKDVPAKEKVIPVHVERAISTDVPLYIKATGHIEAYETVNIMAQVDGQLVKTYFTDGADVEQGELLYLIDQRPYLAALEQAEGELAQNMASLGYAERRAERNSQLVHEEYISQNDYDSLVTDVMTKDAAIKQSRAAVDTAKIHLGYTTIYAPLDGRTGESHTRDGNLILESGETTLVTINRITPIYSTFYINEKELTTVQHFQKKCKELQVLVTPSQQGAPIYKGALAFIDNEIDLATGMIKLKGLHPNREKTLWPNEYVQVTLILDTLEGAILIPTQAVQTSASGKYLYVVTNNQTAEKREVVLGQMQDNNTVVITKGLETGEKVVTAGQLNLYPGAKVSIIRAEEK